MFLKKQQYVFLDALHRAAILQIIACYSVLLLDA